MIVINKLIQSSTCNEWPITGSQPSVGQSIDSCVDVDGKLKWWGSKLSVYLQKSLLKTMLALLQTHQSMFSVSSVPVVEQPEERSNTFTTRFYWLVVVDARYLGHVGMVLMRRAQAKAFTKASHMNSSMSSPSVSGLFWQHSSLMDACPVLNIQLKSPHHCSSSHLVAAGSSGCSTGVCGAKTNGSVVLLSKCSKKC